MSAQMKVIQLVSAAEIGKTRAELSQARHLPGEIYTSPQLYEHEMHEYFEREWLYVGRVEQFPASGDYEARRVLNRPIIISRDNTGALHAFYNMCRHRGVEVAEGRGNTNFFKCPYHGWSYDLTGKLAGAAYMKESAGFNPAECRLRHIHLETWRGNIFINFAAEPRPFAQAMSEFEKDFAILNTEQCQLADVTCMQLDCNWKFFHENLMDYYHVGVLHVKTFGARFSWTPDNLQLKEDGGLTMRYAAAPSTPDGKSLFGKAPWLEHEENSFALTGFMPPNLTMFARIDMVKFIVAWPLGPDKCEVFIYLLFPQEFFSHPDFAEKVAVYREYQQVIYEEDRSMIESMQRNMALPFYEPGRMSVMEKPIHHFLSKYADRMFGKQ